MFICPRITLINPKTNIYCNEPNPKGCNDCINIDMPFNASNIMSWRRKYKNFIYSASKIICPSNDVAIRIKKYYPESSIAVAYHEELPKTPSKIILNSIDKKMPIRIAIIGALAQHKGSEFVSNLLEIIEKSNAQFEIRLIGFIQDSSMSELLTKYNFFSCTGQYIDEELTAEIKKYNPHLILFTSRWPETYSYTLSSALLSGYPILAPEIGAFPERLNMRPWTWLYKIESNNEEILSQLIDIRNHIENKFPPKLIMSKATSVAQDKDFYNDKYLEY